jgi:LysM repeat protein
MRTYTVKLGDTLGGIARKYYHDASMHKQLAAYNGIIDPNRIYPGQIIEMPAKSVLIGSPAATPAAQQTITPPHGLDQIVAVFGDIFDYIGPDGVLDPQWESDYLAKVELPFSIRLSWDQTKVVKNLYCHKELIEIFPAVFADIERSGLRDEIKTYGGCFNYRTKRNGSKISTHSWAIAIDLNPTSNPMGSAGDMDQRIVDIFRAYGFTWGGDWSGSSKDPMHFQFCSGY